MPFVASDATRSVLIHALTSTPEECRTLLKVLTGRQWVGEDVLSSTDVPSGFARWAMDALRRSAGIDNRSGSKEARIVEESVTEADYLRVLPESEVRARGITPGWSASNVRIRRADIAADIGQTLLPLQEGGDPEVAAPEVAAPEVAAPAPEVAAAPKGRNK